MYLINKYIKSNIVLYFENFLITNFQNTIIINKIKTIFKKKIIIKINEKKKIIKKFFFDFLLKKIKFGYFINKNLFISNNLISTSKLLFPKKIFCFEILFKKINIEKSTFFTRRFNFKKKKINKIIINKNYLGIIKNVTNYGVFIDIGNADGLLHISDIPNIIKIYKKLYIRNLIFIKIIKFDKKLKKISLNLKKNYNKNNEKIIYENTIKCKTKNCINNGVICYNKNSKKFLILNISFFLKKNDIIKAYYIKKNEKFFYLNFYNKINKNNLKYQKLIIKYKFNNFFLLSYKKNKFLYKNILSKININKIDFYKFFLFNKINNNFNKIIFLNDNYYLKNNNFFIKLKYKKKYFNIKKIFLYKKKIFCYIRKY